VACDSDSVPELAGGVWATDDDDAQLGRDPFGSAVLQRPVWTVRRYSSELSATWRSGYAAACKAVYTGSIPVVASPAIGQGYTPSSSRL
jgi:hypothetical protein